MYTVHILYQFWSWSRNQPFDGNNCLVGHIFKSLDLLESSGTESNNNMVNIQSNNEVMIGSILKINLDLLDKFEVNEISDY